MRERILASLLAAANANLAVAIGWHVAIGVFLVALALGWRPGRRVVAMLSSVPLASVALVAVRAGNPFNALVFGALATAASIVGARGPREPIALEHPVLATAFVAFAWTYWHFVEQQSFVMVLYGAPLGVLPCPTLALLVGLALLTGTYRHRAWSWIVTLAAGAYGVFGTLGLRVGIDLFLVLGAVILGFATGISDARGAGPRRARARA